MTARMKVLKAMLEADNGERHWHTAESLSMGSGVRLDIARQAINFFLSTGRFQARKTEESGRVKEYSRAQRIIIKTGICTHCGKGYARIGFLGSVWVTCGEVCGKRKPQPNIAPAGDLKVLSCHDLDRSKCIGGDIDKGKQCEDYLGKCLDNGFRSCTGYRAPDESGSVRLSAINPANSYFYCARQINA